MSPNSPNQHANPFAEMRRLLAEAAKSGEPDCDTGVLAVASPEGTPSARTVNFHLTEADQFAFFVSARSLKAEDLARNPQVAFCVFWKRIQVQVNMDGVATPLNIALADHLWSQRNRDMQLMAHAMSQPLAAGETLVDRKRELKHAFADQRVPRPSSWTGFGIQPEHIAIWPTGWHRARAQQHYVAVGDGFRLAGGTDAARESTP